jgi:hypothetical protein
MIKVDYKVLIRCYPGEIIFYAVGVIVGLALMTVHASLGGAIAGVSVVACFVNLNSWKGHFSNGALLPAIVVNPDKSLIAVIADLDAQGGHPHPVVKIVKRPIISATGAPFKKGARLATIATFHNSNIISNKRWTDFNPIVVNCATANRKTIKRALGAIDEEDWELLLKVVKKLDQPFKPGIYPL